jgi:hypothetical protein
MNVAGIVEVSLGILGRVTEGISQAIAAARADNDDQAMAILEQALTETAAGLMTMRTKLAANKAQALKDLDAKFDKSEREEDTDPGTPAAIAKVEQP